MRHAPLTACLVLAYCLVYSSPLRATPHTDTSWCVHFSLWIVEAYATQCFEVAPFREIETEPATWRPSGIQPARISSGVLLGN